MAKTEDVKVKPRSKRAKRILEKREPKLVSFVVDIIERQKIYYRLRPWS